MSFREMVYFESTSDVKPQQKPPADEGLLTQIVRFQHVEIKLIYNDYIYYIYINK